MCDEGDKEAEMVTVIENNKADAEGLVDYC